MGALSGYIEAEEQGIKLGKSWLILAEACDVCVSNEEAGVISLHAPFPSGDDAPPAHPNCRCVIVPVVGDEQSGDED
jgi:hypothetical protein